MVTALLPIVSTISEGFNEAKPAKQTVTVAVDISKAFDTVDITLLLEQTSHTDLHPNIVRWLATYLRGRTAACVYQGVRSVLRIIHAGVPQGSVLSPALFNFFVSDCPDTSGLKTSFADDFTIAASSTNLQAIEDNLNSDLTNISLWAHCKHLRISPEKSQVTLFTSDTHQSKYQPQVYYEGALIPLEKNPKILGVILDTHHTFSPHIKNIVAKASSRLNILKALTGTSWGQKKEIILMTYKSIIAPVMHYAAPIWMPNISNTSLAKLQIIQNKALRIATGCYTASSADHVHHETKTLPMSEHLSLLSTQFLANALKPLHVSHAVVTTPLGPWRMKETLQSKFCDAVSPFLTDGVIPPASYNQVLTTLHTTAVAKAIASSGPNRVQ